MTDREKFEAWWIPLPDGLDVELEKNADGGYLNMHTAIAWSSWQASRKQMAEEAAAVCAQYRNDEKTDEWKSDCTIGREFGSRAIEAAIRSLATPTEGKT